MMKVVILDGEMAGTEFPITYDFTSIGREEGVDIHIPTDASISRRHAVVRKEYGRYILEDLGSTNGTYIVRDDGKEEEVVQSVLSNGKIFRVGKTNMKVISSDSDVIIESQENDDIELVADSPDDFAIRSTIDPGEVYATSFLQMPNNQKSLDELNHKLKVFYEIGTALGKILDLDELLEKIVDSLFEMFPTQRGYLMLINEKTNELETKVVKRKDNEGNTTMADKIEVSKTIIKQVLKEKKAILSDDARLDERFGMPDSVFLHDIRATLYAPLMLGTKVIGILCIDNFTSSHVFTENDLRLLSVIANQAAQSIENARLHDNLRRLFISSIRALANAIEARDVYTRGHSERVTEYSIMIAQGMGLDREEVEKIRYAALLHDIGKINIREDILNKPGRLTDEEYYIMSQHPVYGARIMEPVEEFKDILPYVYHHHERYDNKGYPDKLGGEDIPLASRILAVADSFDAMTSDRPYRNAMSLEKAVAELERNSGTQFDSQCVEIFIELIRTRGSWLKAVMKTGLNTSRHRPEELFKMKKKHPSRPDVKPELSSEQMLESIEKMLHKRESGEEEVEEKQPSGEPQEEEMQDMKSTQQDVFYEEDGIEMDSADDIPDSVKRMLAEDDEIPDSLKEMLSSSEEIPSIERNIPSEEIKIVDPDELEYKEEGFDRGANILSEFGEEGPEDIDLFGPDATHPSPDELMK